MHFPGRKLRLGDIQDIGQRMTYLVMVEHRGGGSEVLDEFETRRAAMICINQYRLDDEGHDDYWRLWIEDDGRMIYKHVSTNYIVDKLSAAEKRSGRILTER
jgi:hypothetical protein